MVQAVSRYYPVIRLAGPRQSGKTTLLKKLYHDRPYRPLSDFFRPLEVVGKLASVPAERRILVYGGEEVQSRSMGRVLGRKAALGAAW